MSRERFFRSPLWVNIYSLTPKLPHTSQLLMFRNIAMLEDCVIINNMSKPETSLRICILMEDGYVNFDPGYYLNDYTWEKVIMESPVLERLRSVQEQSNFDVYLNLCEGYEEPYYSGLDVVRALEKLHLPFTGADSKFYTPSRDEMQSVAERHGIGFARGVNVPDVGKVEALVDGLRYPLIVKHPNSYGSVGMTRKSRVETLKGLRMQVRRICRNFGSARVEEFIDGREFTAFVVDNPDDLANPFIYPPAELTIPDGESFLHSQVKWQEYVYLKRVEDDKLAVRLKDMTWKMYRAMNGVGYARCDIRMNESGELFMLEINPNNGILYEPKDLGPADIMIEYDPDGHNGFLDQLFRSALVRHQAGNLKVN
jgi:D-alanine-D-alanine ligase